MNENSSNQNVQTQKKSGWYWAILILAILGTIFVGFVVYSRYFLDKETAGEIFNFKPTPKEVKTTTSKLDGTTAPEDVANRHPLAVMVENHPEARPQAGLDEASFIYEAITEGGITRFLAIYGPRIPTKVGPVRSARTYYIDWLSEYDAFYAHVGGNLDALDKIRQLGILDLDQFAIGAAAYWREPAKGVAVEHTMFADPQKLYAEAQKKGWPKTKEINNYSFKKESVVDAALSQKVTIDFSSPQYKVEWVYSQTEKAYLRTLGGYAHKDRITGNQLSGKNIIALSVERTYAPTSINEEGFAMQTIGEGKALVFQEGKKTMATWKKKSRTSMTTLIDSGGNEIKLIPGETWFEITPPDVFDKIIVE